MIWHYAPSTPLIIKQDKITCVVEIKEAYSDNTYYELMYWHRDGKYFSKITDPKGVMGLDSKFIVRWGFVEDDDSLLDEQLSLIAIKNAVDHVQSLYDILLSDGLAFSEDYADKIGLTDLHSLKHKLNNRIS